GLAAGFGIASALVFLLWESVPGLLVARLVQGMGVGLTTSPAPAAMVELAQRGAVRRPATGAMTATTVAHLGGLGAGALVGGVISEWVPGPLTAPFLVYGAALTLGGLALIPVPETAPRARTAGGRHGRTGVRCAASLVAVPHGRAREYYCSGALGLTAFAVFGTFTALVPVILADVLDSPSRVLSGVLVLLVMGTAAGAQLLLRAAPQRTLALT